MNPSPEATDYLVSRQKHSERITLIGVGVYTARYEASDPHADMALYLAFQATDRADGQAVFAAGKGLLDCADGGVQVLSLGLFGLEPDIESIATNLDTTKARVRRLLDCARCP